MMELQSRLIEANNGNGGSIKGAKFPRPVWIGELDSISRFQCCRWRADNSKGRRSAREKFIFRRKILNLITERLPLGNSYFSVKHTDQTLPRQSSQVCFRMLSEARSSFWERPSWMELNWEGITLQRVKFTHACLCKIARSSDLLSHQNVQSKWST